MEMQPVPVVRFRNQSRPSHVHTIIREITQLPFVLVPRWLSACLWFGGGLEHARDVTRLQRLDDLLLQRDVFQIVVPPQTSIEYEQRRFR